MSFYYFEMFSLKLSVSKSHLVYFLKVTVSKIYYMIIQGGGGSLFLKKLSILEFLVVK